MSDYSGLAVAISIVQRKVNEYYDKAIDASHTEKEYTYWRINEAFEELQTELEELKNGTVSEV